MTVIYKFILLTPFAAISAIGYWCAYAFAYTMFFVFFSESTNTFVMPDFVYWVVAIHVLYKWVQAANEK